MWIHNLAEFFDKMTGTGTTSIEQNVQYHGRRCDLRRIFDLEQPQVPDARFDPRKVGELAAGEDLGVTGGERRATRMDLGEGLAGIVE
jgi:hypothetical protein